MRVVALAGMTVVAASILRSLGLHRRPGLRAFGAFDFDTYESEDYITEYAQAIHVAAEGLAGLPTYSVGGEPVDLGYQGLETGPRGERNSGLDAGLRIPPTVLKSIAWIEANWSNASGLVPFGGVGPALVSPDCGYGLGQITSGMANTTGTASARQAAIGTHPLFNLAEGARILADKWNAAPNFRPIAGTGDPAAIEDWYYAIWSYNGFAFSNHPLNPNRDPLRAGNADSPIYHCFEPLAPSYQGALYGYGDYTYPERVYGCMRHPPVREDQRLWQSQFFRMPDFGLEIISAAFAPSNFLDCEEGGFSGGCPAMDYPTTIDTGELLIPHADTTGPADPSWRARWLGDPVFSYSGPASLPLTAFTDGTATSGVVRVRNVGVGIAPFRIRTSHPWIVVRHDNDPFVRGLDGSVAVGSRSRWFCKGRSPSRGLRRRVESVLRSRWTPPRCRRG
jgi:hypothetical protein